MSEKKYVVGFVFDKKTDLVLLIRKNKPEWQKGYLNGVGGKIEETDADDWAAMSRECEEETGLLIPSSNWVHVGKMIRKGEFDTRVLYAIHDDILQAKQMEEEKLEIHCFESIVKCQEETIDNIPMLVNYCWMCMSAESNKYPDLLMTYPKLDGDPS